MGVVVVSPDLSKQPEFKACGAPCPENPAVGCHKHFQHFGTHMAHWPSVEPGKFDGYMWETLR